MSVIDHSAQHYSSGRKSAGLLWCVELKTDPFKIVSICVEDRSVVGVLYYVKHRHSHISLLYTAIVSVVDLPPCWSVIYRSTIFVPEATI